MSIRRSIWSLSLALCATFGTLAAPAAPASAGASLYIVQAVSAAAARRSVQRVGAHVQRELGIIHAVSAPLSEAQVVRLTAVRGVRLYRDRTLSMRSSGGLLGAAGVERQQRRQRGERRGRELRGRGAHR